jgi:uroporphyrinogen decarboxylase
MEKPYINMLQNPEACDNIPIWMMRQAGRTLPEYREIRTKHDFLDMVYTPDIACEVTCQPIRRFGFDAAVLFSDILVIPQALGMGLSFTKGMGPQFSTTIQSQDAANALQPNPQKLDPIYTAIQYLKKELPTQTALVGFAGAPFTVASYMIEGGSSKDLKTTKTMMIANPTLFKHILDTVTAITIDYLEQQCLAGADALQLFDTWINHLDWKSCQQWSAQYVKTIVSTLRQRGIQQPITFFGKHTSLFYPLYTNTGVNVISFDWNGNLKTIAANLPTNIGIQGNLDPFHLYGTPDTIEHAVKTVCQSVPKDRSHIFNLGHGLMPDIPIESIQCVVDTVRSFKR